MVVEALDPSLPVSVWFCLVGAEVTVLGSAVVWSGVW